MRRHETYADLLQRIDKLEAALRETHELLHKKIAVAEAEKAEWIQRAYDLEKERKSARAWARRWRACAKQIKGVFRVTFANWKRVAAERDEARRDAAIVRDANSRLGIGLDELEEERGRWNEQHAQQHRVNTQLAAERDRLKAESDKWNELYQGACRRLDEGVLTYIENAKLKAALQRIASHTEHDPLGASAMRQWAAEALS